MAIGALVAGVVGAVGSAAIKSRGARDAARTQGAAVDKAVGRQDQTEMLARSDLQPFTKVGTGILNQLSDFVSSGPESDFERTQGFEDIQQSAAAGGKLRSGETLAALTEFNAGVNQRFRTQRFNELMSLANLGQSSAVGQANISLRTGENVSSLLVGKGDALAAGQIGSANAIGAGIKGVGDAFGSYLGRGL